MCLCGHNFSAKSSLISLTNIQDECRTAVIVKRTVDPFIFQPVKSRWKLWHKFTLTIHGLCKVNQVCSKVQLLQNDTSLSWFMCTNIEWSLLLQHLTSNLTKHASIFFLSFNMYFILNFNLINCPRWNLLNMICCLLLMVLISWW